MTKTIASVSLTSLIGMTVAAAATDENGSLLLSFDDGSSAVLERDAQLEGTLTLKGVEGDLDALVGGTLDTLLADFDDVSGRPDMIGVDGVISLLIGTETNAEATLTWHGTEAGDDILSERSLVSFLIPGEIAMPDGETAEKKVPTIAPATLGDALAAAMADSQDAEIPAEEVETAASEGGEPQLGEALDAAIAGQSEAAAEEATTEAEEVETAEVETAEVETAEAPAADAETAATDWSYPVGEEHPLIMVYPVDTFPKDAFFARNKKWTDEQREKLATMFRGGATMADLVAEFGRTPVSMIVKLAEAGLVVEDHPYAARLAETNAKREAARAEAAAKKVAEAA